MKKVLIFLIYGFLILGIVDAGYLIYSQSKNSLICNILKGCNIVLSSEYSKMFNIPLSLWGLFYYFSLFLFFNLSFQKENFKVLFEGLILVGLGLYIVLLFVQGIELSSFCDFCVFSAIITFTIFLLYLALQYASKKTKN